MDEKTPVVINKAPKTPDSPFAKWNPRQVKFMRLYVQTGNITRSWMSVYKTKNPTGAWIAANKFLKKNEGARQAFFELHGIDDASIAKVIKDGMGAKKQIVVDKQVEEYADHNTRIKAAELAEKVKGNDSSDKKIGNQLNVQIITEKGEFRVMEG